GAGQPDLDGAVIIDTIVRTFAHAHETLSSARFGSCRSGVLLGVKAISCGGRVAQATGTPESRSIASKRGGKKVRGLALPSKRGPPRFRRSSSTPGTTPAPSWPDPLDSSFQARTLDTEAGTQPEQRRIAPPLESLPVDHRQWPRLFQGKFA